MAVKMKVPVQAHITPSGTVYTVDGKPLGEADSVPLSNVGGAARGHIIRGGSGGWESYDASGARQVLIGDGTDVVSRALEEADIPPEIARDTEVTAEIATHAADASAHHDPVTLDPTGDPALHLTGQVLKLDDVATQAELDAHAADASAHHAPVTLSSDADGVLELSGQQLDLDAQAAGAVLAGPVSGADAKPAFRALNASDYPDALLSDGSRAGATAQAQDFGSNGVKTDALAPSSGNNVTIGGRLLLPSHPMARAERTTAQTIPDSTWELVRYSSVERYDRSASYDLPAARFTAPVTGVYHIEASVLYDSAAWPTGAVAWLRVRINGADADTLARYTAEATGTRYVMLSGSTETVLTSGDYVEIWTRHTRGGDSHLFASGRYNRFTVRLVG